MTDQQIVVIGVFPTFATLEVGVQALKNGGFRNADVSVLYPEKRSPNRTWSEGDAISRRATSSDTEGLVGGILGWLAGAGSLVIPGIAPLIAVGPIVGALARACAEKNIGVAGGLAGLGISQADADIFERCLRDGRTLLSVHPDNDYWALRAREVMEKSGAQNVSTSGKRARRG